MMRNKAKKAISLVLAVIMLTTLAIDLTVVGSAAPTTFTKVNYLQSDSRWRYLSYNNSYLQASGCGILSIVNAVYNCTGNFIEPKTVADWAHAAKYFNQGSSGGGICNEAVFSKAAEVFGSTYGFTYVGGGSGTASSTTLQNHVANVGTAIVHVYGHYMCLVEYNPSTGKFLVFDCAPGSGSNYNSINRRNLTTAGGDWKTVAELSTGYIDVDRYWLYAPTGSAASPIDPNSYPLPARALYYTSPIMTGDDVKWVQAVLSRLGYSASIDGSFGPATQTQVKAFQTALGLTANGRVEGDTLTQLQIQWGVVDPNHDLDLVNCVIAISCIGTVTANSGATIEYVESLYNALNSAQKAQVTNYQTLVAARAAYNALISSATPRSYSVDVPSSSALAGTSATYSGAINFNSSRGTADGCGYMNYDPNPTKAYRATMEFVYNGAVATDPYHNSDQGVILVMLGSGKTMGYNFATGNYFIAAGGGGWSGDPTGYIAEAPGSIVSGGCYRFEYVVENDRLSLVVNGTTVVSANVSGAFSSGQYYIFYPKHVNIDITYTRLEYADNSAVLYTGVGSSALTGFVGYNSNGTPYTAIADTINVSYNASAVHTHSMTYVAAVAATCTAAGTAAYYRCSGCSKIFTDSTGANETTVTSLTTSALSHDYRTSTVSPTCTAAGRTTYTCSRCSDSYSQTIAALGHDYHASTVAPTCTAAGATTYTCSRCSNSYSQTIAALGHDYALTSHADASCTQSGYNVYTCSHDSAHSYCETIPATGHTFSGGVCTVCGAADPSYVPPVVPGDVDGDGHLNASDVIALMHCVVGGAQGTAIPTAADFNGDGKINSRDVLLLMLAIVNGEL